MPNSPHPSKQRLDPTPNSSIPVDAQKQDPISSDSAQQLPPIYHNTPQYLVGRCRMKASQEIEDAFHSDANSFSPTNADRRVDSPRQLSAADQATISAMHSLKSYV